MKISIFIILALLAAACLEKHKADLPKDLLGLTLGMDKAESQLHLQEIAEFMRDERNDQQLWKLKDASRFSSVAIGYNRENKVRYITAFVDKENAKEMIPFSAVGDLHEARAEILEPHYRYIWEIPSTGTHETSEVNIYGDNPEFITIYSLVEKSGKPDEVDED